MPPTLPSLIRWCLLCLAMLCVSPTLVLAQSATPAQGEIPDGYGRLVVIANYDSTEVEINGVSYPYEWIYGDLEGIFLPADRQLDIIVSASEDNRRTFRFRLEDGETRVLVVDIESLGSTPSAPRAAPRREAEEREEEEEEEDENEGYLGVSSSPRGVVHVDGAETDQRTPARRIPLEPGRHEVQVYYDEEGVMSETKHVLIRAGVNTNVFFRLRREQLEEEE